MKVKRDDVLVALTALVFWAVVGTVSSNVAWGVTKEGENEAACEACCDTSSKQVRTAAAVEAEQSKEKKSGKAADAAKAEK